MTQPAASDMEVVLHARPFHVIKQQLVTNSVNIHSVTRDISISTDKKRLMYENIRGQSVTATLTCPVSLHCRLLFPFYGQNALERSTMNRRAFEESIDFFYVKVFLRYVLFRVKSSVNMLSLLKASVFFSVSLVNS